MGFVVCGMIVKGALGSGRMKVWQNGEVDIEGVI